MELITFFACVPTMVNGSRFWYRRTDKGWNPGKDQCHIPERNVGYVEYETRDNTDK